MKSKKEITMDRDRYGLKVSETQSGFDVKEVYSPEDSSVNYEKDLGDPGKYPFTRGIYPSMYRTRIWAMENPVGWHDVEASNERLTSEIELGLNAIYLGNDDIIKTGVDADHPLAVNDCLCTCIYMLSIMERLLEGISLEGGVFEIHESESTWGDACQLAMLMALADRRGTERSKIRGTVLNDPILNHAGGFVAADYWPFEIPYKLHGDMVDFIVKHLPKWKAFVPCGNDYHEAGVDVVQQVAFVIGETRTYIDYALERGLKFEDVANRFVLSFAASFDFFETVAKVRAARRMWAKIAKDRFGATDSQLCRARVTVRVGASTLPAQNPLNNIARITLQALAAVMAGTNSVDYCAFDEGLSIPTRRASILNLSLNSIIAQETRVPLVIDPLGGSYYVEWLTNKIEDEATKLMEKIDSMGGMLGALEKGWLRKEIKEAGLERARKIDDGRWPVVDLNQIVVPETERISVEAFNYGGNRKRACEKLVAECKKLKETRDIEKVKQAIRDLRQKAEKRGNLIYPMIEAFKTDATRSEILGTIREAFGYSYDPFNMIQRPAFMD